MQEGGSADLLFIASVPGPGLCGHNDSTRQGSAAPRLILGAVNS